MTTKVTYVDHTEAQAARDRQRHNKAVLLILRTMRKRGITLKDLIDGMIEAEGIVGAELVTLDEELYKIVGAHLKNQRLG